jgi:hypothetical protein
VFFYTGSAVQHDSDSPYTRGKSFYRFAVSVYTCGNHYLCGVSAGITDIFTQNGRVPAGKRKFRLKWNINGLVQQPILLNPAGFRLLNKSRKMLCILLVL